MNIKKFGAEDFRQITKEDAEKLKKGDVILVRSDYKYEKYGDHFAVIVGGKIKKERGVRPNLVVLFISNAYYTSLLDQFIPTNGAVILKLSARAAEHVMRHYRIHLSEGDLVSI